MRYYDSNMFTNKTGLIPGIRFKEADNKIKEFKANLLVIGELHLPTQIMTGQNGTWCRAFSPDMVQNVEFLPKQSDPKVVKMTFSDGTVTTAAAQEGDEFNAEYGMSMCILKYIWCSSGYNTFFRKWMKVDKKRKDDAKAAKIKAEQDAEKARRKNEKRDARRAKKEAEEREDLIDIIASAIKKASGKEDK